MKRLAFALLIVLAGCATTNLPPVGSPGFALEDEERAIWRMAASEEGRLDTGGDVYEDAQLERYLNDVLHKVSPAGVDGVLHLRVKVLRNFRLNAFALPHGAIYIHTGLLARMDNEAQLALLFSHELTHATHRHAMRGQRSASNWSGAMAGVSAMTLGLAAPLGNLAWTAAVSGHSRDHEREADSEGLHLTAMAGYDISSASELFRHLEEWVKEEGEQEPFFFGSHPRIKERRQSCADFERKHPGGGGARNEEAFRSHVAGALLVNAGLALDAGRYDAARRDAERHLAWNARSAPAHALLGEAARRRGDPSVLQESLVHYRQALQLDPRLASAHRGLGLALHKLGDRAGARAALSRYLELEPRAPDRAHITALLEGRG